ncbi:MAG TPA: histidine phosphatase family protein [Pirellulales bacterium]|jgi:probable phosphoglycerate mutase|nr:histidine phosphatase family protein [Pirellulales bacterium]
MLLYLVRHGQSLYNAERRIQGQFDIGLSPFGLRQSIALAAAFRTLAIDAVYASPLSRAMQTAEPIAEALHLPIQADDRLKEINAGVFQGVLWEEIEQHSPDLAARWREQDPDFVIPGGESRRALGERGRAALEAIHAAEHRQAVVVAHGGVLAGALKSLLEIPIATNPFSFYNASISKIAWDSRIKLLTLNQLDHLAAAGLDESDSTGDL